MRVLRLRVVGPFLVSVAIAVTGFVCSAEAESFSLGTSDFEFEFLYRDHYAIDDAVVRKHTEWMGEHGFVVALHLARQSEVELDVIVEWRRDGRSWWEITDRCDLGPESFRVELPDDPGPPYGRAWGHWKKHPKTEIRLDDEEIQAWVVLRAMRDFTKRPAAEIVRLQRDGWTPRKIAGYERSDEDASPEPSRGKGKKAKGKRK